MEHFWDIKLVDLFIPILTVVAVGLGYWQLCEFRKHRRIEFTYQLYRDFFNYLNDERNKDLRDWLFGRQVPGIEHEKIGDLLEQFEALWSLQNEGLVEGGMAYDLFAFYILRAGSAENPTTEEYIAEIKVLEKESHDYTDDLFEGYEELLAEMRRSKGKKQARDLMKQRRAGKALNP